MGRKSKSIALRERKSRSTLASALYAVTVAAAAIQVRIDATNSLTVWWVPHLIHFVVSSPNQRSTRFSHEL